MRRLFRYSFVLLIVFLQLVYSGEKVLSFEAESGQYNEMQLLQDENASGGAYLAMQKTGDASWKFEISDSGWYNLKIRYRSPQGEKENLLVKNGMDLRTGFGWADKWTALERPVVLNSGVNTLILKSNWGWIDVDCITIEKTELLPAFTPKKNAFYTQNPRDIYIKLNAFGKNLQSISVNDEILPFDREVYPYEEDAWMLRIAADDLSKLQTGAQQILLNFETGEPIAFSLEVQLHPKPAEMMIIAPDISHGNSALVLLPNGETMLVDCAQAYYRDAVVVPLLEKNGIEQIDYLILTHYHDDHDSGDKGQTIRDKFQVKHFSDYQSYKSGDEFNVGDVHFRILNAWDDGEDENTRSLAFQMEYKGFVYRHDADIYAKNQRRIMEQFPEDDKAHVYFANHHFHGSSNAEYMRWLNPDVVLNQAEKAIYARSTYTTTFLKNTVEWLKEKQGKTVENLQALEVGTSVIRVNSGDDWCYETYKDCMVPLIPGLPQDSDQTQKYQHILELELGLKRTTGDMLSSTAFLQLENLERAGENLDDNAKHIERTKKELDELIEWIRAGKDYFQEKRGRIKIGYLSEIDSSLQPFDLMIPNKYDSDKKYGLVLYLHGKEGGIQKYRNLLWADSDPSLDGMNVFKVAVYARRNVYYQGAGEADILRVIEEIKKHYPIDENRVYLAGASMGGFGSWYFGLNYTDQFAAISPVCGRTIKGTEFYWQTVNPASYVENALHLPVRFYHGDIDPVVPVTDSRTMKTQMDSLGYEYIYTEFPGVKHNAWKNAGKDKERMPWLTKYQCDANPDTVIKKCFYLKHGKAYWTEITAKTDWDEFAKIQAINNAGVIDIKTNNVAEFQLEDLPVSDESVSVIIDKQSFVVDAIAPLNFYLDENVKWHQGKKAETGLQKTKGLEGPWLDAEMNPFLIVYGTTGDDNGQRLKEIGQKLLDYYLQFDMEPRLIADTGISVQIIGFYNLHLLGGPDENSYVNKIRKQLPVDISQKKFTLDKKYSRKFCGLRMICPNPENSEHYVRIDLFPGSANTEELFELPVADYLVYSQKMKYIDALKNGFFNVRWEYEE